MRVGLKTLPRWQAIQTSAGQLFRCSPTENSGQRPYCDAGPFSEVTSMKNMLITLFAALALTGCNNPEKDSIEQSKDATKDSLNSQKRAVDDAADAARTQSDA